MTLKEQAFYRKHYASIYSLFTKISKTPRVVRKKKKNGVPQVSLGLLFIVYNIA